MALIKDRLIKAFAIHPVLTLQAVLFPRFYFTLIVAVFSVVGTSALSVEDEGL